MLWPERGAIIAQRFAARFDCILHPIQSGVEHGNPLANGRGSRARSRGRANVRFRECTDEPRDPELAGGADHQDHAGAEAYYAVVALQGLHGGVVSGGNRTQSLTGGNLVAHDRGAAFRL